MPFVMMFVMGNERKTRKSKSKSLVGAARKHQKVLYFVIPPILVLLYLNTANNHFYHRLHTAGLVWPQNQPMYKVGEGKGKVISYIALGDSLTAGVGASGFEHTYSYLVAKKIIQPNQTINLTPLSTPGYKSVDLINYHLDQAIQLKPDIVTILVGVNDVHGLGPSARGFHQNYETLVRRLDTETKADIYLIAIPYIGTDSLLWPPYRNYYSARTKTFNNIIEGLAKQYGARYIDLYSNTIQYAKKNSPYYSKDEFHPSAEGYAIWASIVAHDINN